MTPPTTLEWFGTATFRVRHAGLDLFFDAYLDRLPGLDPVGLSAAGVDKADFVFVSHAHFDHLYGADAIALRQLHDPSPGGPVRAEQGAAAEPGVGLVEHLHDVVAGLRGQDQRAELPFGHADLELGLHREGDVVRQALDLAEPVELRRRVREGVAGHVVFPQAFMRWDRASNRR